MSFETTDALKLTGCKVINNQYVKVEPGTLTKAEQELLDFRMQHITSGTVPIYTPQGAPWTKEETNLFKDLMRKYGKNWREISKSFPTRTLGACERFGYKLLNNGQVEGVRGNVQCDSFFKEKKHQGWGRG